MGKKVWEVLFGHKSYSVGQYYFCMKEFSHTCTHRLEVLRYRKQEVLKYRAVWSTSLSQCASDIVAREPIRSMLLPFLVFSSKAPFWKLSSCWTPTEDDGNSLPGSSGSKNLKSGNTASFNRKNNSGNAVEQKWRCLKQRVRDDRECKKWKVVST